MLADTNDRPPGLDEQYLIATNTSNLTLNPDKVCAATHLIAAGLLGNRMGEALSHLRSEWDSSEKPRKKTEDEIMVRAHELPKRKDKPDVKRARTEALVGHAVALRHHAHGLPGWLPALSIMAEWAILRDVDIDLLSPALYHWLAPVCPVCDGVGERWLFGSVTERKPCYHCNGQRAPGKTEGPTIWPRPLGAEGIHKWFARCEGRARGERGGLINERIDASDLRERTERQHKPAPEVSDEAADAVAADLFRLSMTSVKREQRKE
jgi:hypothetical protein